MNRSVLLSCLRSHKVIIILTVVYFAFRTAHLTAIPIFNDEAIYLYWGWRETHMPGLLFFSLYDAKPPLLMWLFGISQNFFTDPLFAGRIVAVLSGWIAMFGIFIVSKKYFDKKTAIIAALIYIAIPLFSFFDRQALMESSVGAVGIWSLYFLLRQYEDPPQRKYAFALGVILGLGYFIKTSAFIFLVLFIGLTAFIVIRKPTKRIDLLKNGMRTLIAFFVTIFLLLLQPLFWDTLSTNDRYISSLREIFSSTPDYWVEKIVIHFKIFFYLVTPFIIMASSIGIILLFKKKNMIYLLFIMWFIGGLLLQGVVIRNATMRYAVAFLPFIVIPAAYVVSRCMTFNKIKGLILTGTVMLPAIVMTSLQLFYPLSYFQVLPKSLIGDYVSGFSSGYGINEAREYLITLAKDRKIFVGVARNTGNPESAMFVYFNKNTNVQTGYFDALLFGNELEDASCLTYDLPVYFVSRDEQQGGLEKYLIFVKRFYKPDRKASIGVYTLNDSCTGKTLPITLRDI